jgi:hypothetical protein
MGFGYPLVPSVRYETKGQSGGIGTTVTSSATANTKGSYTSLGTAGFDYDAFWLYVTNTQGGSADRYRIDLAVNNGGSDQIIVADMFYDGSTGGSYYNAVGALSSIIPVRIFKGATVKARCQANAGSGTVAVSVQGVQGDARMTGPGRALVNDTAFTNTDPANSISVSGATQTGWTQVVASTSVRYGALFLAASTNGSAPSLIGFRIDVGWGSSGNEKVLFSIQSNCYSGTGSMFGGALGPYPCDIPAGTRIACRVQSSYGSAGGAFLPVVYGFAA